MVWTASKNTALPVWTAWNVSALENKIQRWAWLRATQKTDGLRLLFLSLLPQCLRETWLLGGKNFGIQIQPKCHCPKSTALPSKLQGLRSIKLLKSIAMPYRCNVSWVPTWLYVRLFEWVCPKVWSNCDIWKKSECEAIWDTARKSFWLVQGGFHCDYKKSYVQ